MLPALDQQDEAVGVIAAEDALPRRVEHFERAALARRESLTRPDLARQGAAADDRVVQGQHGRIVLLEHLRRDVDRPHGKTFQHAGQAVEVVNVGVRQHHGVQVGDAPRPEHSGDGPRGGGRGPEFAGVVEQRLPGRQFQHLRAAVSHREERAVEAARAPRSPLAAKPIVIHPASSARHQRRGGRSRGKAASSPKPP